MALILSLAFTATAAAAAADNDPLYLDRAAESILYRITAIDCAAPKDVQEKVLAATWRHSQQTCISCMACGCTCSVKDQLATEDMSMDYTYVSCEKNVYTLHAGGETYTCGEPTLAPVKDGGNQVSPGQTTQPDIRPPEYCALPTTKLLRTENRTIRNMENYQDDAYLIEYYETRDRFALVKLFYDQSTGREGAVGLDTAGQYVAVYPLDPGLSSITIVEDKKTGGANIIVFKFQPKPQ